MPPNTFFDLMVVGLFFKFLFRIRLKGIPAGIVRIGSNPCWVIRTNGWGCFFDDFIEGCDCRSRGRLLQWLLAGTESVYGCVFFSVAFDIWMWNEPLFV